VWQQFSVNSVSGAATSFELLSFSAAGGTVSADILVWHPQLNDITGETDQTTIRPYVSVGVPADWAGPESITNGTFDSATTGWTAAGSGVATVVSSELLITNGGADFGYVYRAISTVIGTKYVVSGTMYRGTATGVAIGAGISQGAIGLGVQTTTSTTSTFATFTFTATGTTTYISMINQSSTSTQTGFYDNISVKPAAYHGSMVDGVKCYDTDRLGNPIATSATYEAVTLNGVAGTYVSTPDSVAASITGDIDIRVKAALTDWTPAAETTLAAKWGTGGATNSWVLQVNTDGALRVFLSTTGANVIIKGSVSAMGFADGAAGWCRVTVDVDNGAAGYDVTFYTSTDGETWTQLGSPVTTATAITLFDPNVTVELGSRSTGTSQVLNGKIFQAQIYNGINGTLAVDFNAARYSGGGTTLTGSTGETWTLNGSAYIPVSNYPIVGYVPWEARTNIALQGNAFATAPWTNGGTPSATQNVVGPDGAISAWTLTDNDGGNIEQIYQNIVLTAAAYTFSGFVKKTVGAAAFPVLQVNNVAFAFATIDTNNGVATAWVSNGYGATLVGVSASCVSYNDSFWRVALTYTATAASYTHYLIPAGTTDATQPTGVLDVAAQGSAVFYGAMVNLGAFAGPYIPTTTVAVARNADVLTYPSAGNLGAVGTIFAEGGYNSAVALGSVVSTGPLATGSYININNAGGTNTGWAATGVNVTGAVANTTNKYAISFSGANFSAVINEGTVVSSGSSDYTASGLTTIGVGVRTDGTRPLNGAVRNIRIWNRKLSDSEMRAITS
jgi:hypothetical protein